MNRRDFLVALTGVLAFGSMAKAMMPDHAVDPVAVDLPPFNRMVLELLRRYPTDGTHGYHWPKDSSYDGSSRDVMMWGRRVLRGEPERRTFCCGLTLEVFLDAWQQWVALNPDAAAALQPRHFDDFRKDWFVREVRGAGPAEALVGRGIGRIVPYDEARPGDFLQLWRTNDTGHSAIFLGWIRNPAEEIVGVNYWSSQKNTNGIAERFEYFDAPELRPLLEAEDPRLGGSSVMKGLMLRDFTVIGRVEPPIQQKPLR